MNLEIPSAKLNQERPTVPTSPPRRLRRVGGGDVDWDLPRSFSGYSAQADISIGGKATKWVLKSGSQPTEFYIAKFGNKNGLVEVVTELFNNQLGAALGFQMAHSGLARLDENLYFVTRNFRRIDERLVHGSLMIEQVFAAPDATQVIDKRQEQSFYSLDVLHDVIREFSGPDAEGVFQNFVEMLVFDALIGAMDRHAQNWGVLQSTTIPERCRLAPIFDTARALFWDFPDGRLVRYESNEEALKHYVLRSKPCIGPTSGHPKVNNCNHFDLVVDLLNTFEHQTIVALDKIPPEADKKADRLLKQFPFDRLFSGKRKRLIVNTIRMRALMLRAILEKGGVHGTRIERQTASA